MKVTRIAFSKEMNDSKYERLAEIASRLGKLRAEVWRKYGSMQGVGVSHRTIRDGWLAEGRQFDVPARLWKETLRDTIADVKAYREAAKEKVRKAIQLRTKENEERKRLYALLKYDRWMEDNFLHRQMRKQFKHGVTRVNNQIILDTGCYTTFELGGRAWLSVMSLKRGQRIAIPLNSTHSPKGTLRLILGDGVVEVHHTIDKPEGRPCGNETIGIDKGYTEAFVDSDGERHGEGLGETLSQESDHLKKKYQNRNKLEAIAKAKPHKRNNIHRCNLGRKKLGKRRTKQTKRVRDKIFKAAHSVVDKAETIVVEDLTSPIKSKRKYGKNQNRRLSGWVKGIMAEALDSVSKSRSSRLVNVSCAYTSQTDSRYGILLGTRKGDWFYCFDGEVLDADGNAARNILARVDDPDIGQFTPHKQVRKILLERTEQFKRLRRELSRTVGTAQPRHQLHARNSH